MPYSNALYCNMVGTKLQRMKKIGNNMCTALNTKSKSRLVYSSNRRQKNNPTKRVFHIEISNFEEKKTCVDNKEHLSGIIETRCFLHLCLISNKHLLCSDRKWWSLSHPSQPNDWDHFDNKNEIKTSSSCNQGLTCWMTFTKSFRTCRRLRTSLFVMTAVVR